MAESLLGAFGAPLDAHLANQLGKMGTDAAPYVRVHHLSHADA